MKRTILISLFSLLVVVGKAQIGLTIDEVKAKYGKPVKEKFDSNGMYFMQYDSIPTIVDGLYAYSMLFYFPSDSPTSKNTFVGKVFSIDDMNKIAALLNMMFVKEDDKWIDYQRSIYHTIIVYNENDIIILHSQKFNEKTE